MEGLRNRSKPQRKKRDKKQKHSKIVELLKLEKENSFKIKPEPLSKKKKKNRANLLESILQKGVGKSEFGSGCSGFSLGYTF